MATTVWEATDNYSFGTLKFSVNTSSTQITFNTGEGNNFNATLQNRVVFFGQAYDNPSDDANREIVRITQNAGDVFDITDGAPAGRGLEGTVAGTWAINDKVALVLTNAKISEIQDAINDLEDGTNPVGDANTVGGKTPTATPTADSVVLSPAGSIPLAIGWMNLEWNSYRAQVATGNAPGIDPSATNARNIRQINTTLVQNITGSSRSGVNFILPAGTYYAQGWSCHGPGVKGVATYVYNVTDAADELAGVNGYQGLTSVDWSQTNVSGVFTIAGTKTFRLETYTQVSQSNGLGTYGTEGTVEIYAQVDIFRIA